MKIIINMRFQNCFRARNFCEIFFLECVKVKTIYRIELSGNDVVWSHNNY